MTTVDRLLNILREPVIIMLVAGSVWASCTVIRWLVEQGTGWLFATSETLGSDNAVLGAAFLLGVMLIAGLVRGLLLRNPRWQDVDGEGTKKAVETIHETSPSGSDHATARYAQSTFSRGGRMIVMSTLTIGSGGSGGLEAPAVFMGETLGAGWSKLFARISADELRLYQLVGIAAGIATLLGTPFAAALFALEIVYAGHIIYGKLAYCLVAGAIGYALNDHALGLGGLFDAPEHTRSFLWNEYLLVVLVALGFSAQAVIVLSPLRKAGEWFFGKFPPVLRALMGAFITGSIGLLMVWLADLRLSDILGVGEKTINEVVAGVGPANLQVWWVLLLAIVAKILATSATIHSGGGAGTLIPAMYVGGLAGAMAYYLLGSMGWPVGPIVGVYVATGMAAALTLIAGVPLTAIAMVIEIFGAAYSPPAALACGLCFLVSDRFNIYQK